MRMPILSAPLGDRPSHRLGHRLSIAARAVAAILGGYALAAAASA
jgi:hypothetical protein